MSHEELLYFLALQKVDGVGDIVAKKLVMHCGSARNVFDAKSRELQSIERVGSYVLRNLRDKSVFEKAEIERDYILKNNIGVQSFLDDSYPERLKHCVDGPLLLFSSGNIDLSNKRMISIVGTRKVTLAGDEFCRQLIADLAPLNPVIVSGFAYGVDIIAHLAAIDNGLQTIAVIGNGLDRVYPAPHKKFVKPIESNGGFFTEFWSRSEPEKENFVRRNRIVAGMSEATIVVESADKGGSLITAYCAADYNRDVFAVPGRPNDKYSQGCNDLIKTQKAHLLTSAADLVYMLNWKLESKKEKPVQKQMFVTLDDDEQRIYDYLFETGKQELDAIALACGMPIYKMSSTLLNMELKGVVRPLPGKSFEAI